MPDERHVLRLDDRLLAREARQLGVAAAERDREVHVGGLAGGRGLAVERVGMAVDHPKRERAAGQPRARERARQQAAVPAQDERALAAFERGADGVAQVARGRDQLVRGDHAGRGVAGGIAQRADDVARVRQPEPLCEPCLAQQIRRPLLAATRPGGVERRAQERPGSRHARPIVATEPKKTNGPRLDWEAGAGRVGLLLYFLQLTLRESDS